MHKGTGSCQGAAALPVALWAEALQHVPQHQRLSQCALVCTTWAKAAAQTPLHVRIYIKADAVPAFQAWLGVHAGQLLSLQLEVQEWPSQPVLQLPLDKLTKLQHLQLKSFKLQLTDEEDRRGAGSSSIFSSHDGCNHAAQRNVLSLQHLQLETVQLASVSSLLQLTKAPQLSVLKLRWLSFAGLKFQCGNPSCLNDKAAIQHVAAAVPRVLQQLPLLTVLELPGFPFTDAAVHCTAAMQQLKCAALEHVGDVPVCSLQHLPSSITQLQLHGKTHSHIGSFSLSPELAQLSGLLHLELSACAVPSALLGSFTQLQVLRLEGCRLLPTDDAFDEYDTEGTAALLAALASLTQLQDLRINLQSLDVRSIAPQHFCSLTASSQLTHLDLRRDYWRAVCRGAVKHMFPPGRQLQLLQHLSISTTPDDEPEEDEWCIDSADISRIITCCPQLQWLDIGSSVQPGADLSVLLQLPETCTSLLVGGDAFTDAAVPIILQLTQLEYLCWSWSPGFTDVGLEQLVGLDLERLYVHSSGLSEQINPEDPGTVDMLGSVSAKLDALCDLSPVLAPARLKKCREEAAARERELANFKAENGRLKQQLALALALFRQQRR